MEVEESDYRGPLSSSTKEGVPTAAPTVQIPAPSLCKRATPLHRSNRLIFNRVTRGFFPSEVQLGNSRVSHARTRARYRAE